MTIFLTLVVAGILVFAGLETARQFGRQRQELTGRLKDLELRAAALEESNTRLAARVAGLEALVERAGVTDKGDE